MIEYLHLQNCCNLLLQRLLYICKDFVQLFLLLLDIESVTISFYGSNDHFVEFIRLKVNDPLKYTIDRRKCTILFTPLSSMFFLLEKSKYPKIVYFAWSYNPILLICQLFEHVNRISSSIILSFSSWRSITQKHLENYKLSS